MPRYVPVPEPFTTMNLITGEPLKLEDGSREVFTFARSCRLACASIAAKGGADALTLIDLRHKTDAGAVGQYLELTEDEWKLLDGEFRRPNPQVFSPAWVFSAERHIRAIAEATGKLPEVLKPEAAAP